MPTYIRLIKVRDAEKMLSDPAWGPEQAAKVLGELGGKVVDVWATLGPYDFVGIVEMPDDGAMMAASARVGARMGIEAVTLPAVPARDFAEAVRR